ncbi:MAG: hypothetical protein QOI35_2205 [Cryptosporangiaceae bacterium]|nr:hypothetical protein [Cryptosporangiaceae bacterium]
MSFSSIDPVAIKAANDRIQSAGKTLADAAAGLKSDLERAGIPTDGVRRVAEIGSWVHDQLPMLRRRQNLAEAMSAQAGHVANGAIQGVVIPGVPDSFLSGSDANRKGQQLADRLMSELMDHEKLPPDLLSELQANSTDPDYMKGFYDKLGPDRLCIASQLVMASDYYRDHGSEADAISAALGTGLATYSRTTPLDDAWMNRIAFPKDMPGGGQFQPEVLAFVLRGSSGAAFDPVFLRALGKKAFSMNIGPMQHRPTVGSWQGDAYTQFTKTISENALASGWVFGDNLGKIQDASKTYAGIPPERQRALANLIQAATITVRGVDPGLAQQNVAQLMFALKADDAAAKPKDGEDPPPELHAYDSITKVYGEIAHTYFDDIAYSVTSLTPSKLALAGPDGKSMKDFDELAFRNGGEPERAGLEVPPDLWTALMQEGMRDPTEAMKLAADFQGYDKRVKSEIYDLPADQAGIASFEAGVMRTFYQQNFATVAKSFGDGIEKWVKDTNEARMQLIEAGFTLVGAAAAPEEAGKQAIDFAKETLTDLSKDLLKGIIAVDENDVPASMKDQVDRFSQSEWDTSWQSIYAEDGRDAAERFLAGQPDAIPPVSGPDKKQITADPHQFINGDPARNFLSDDGKSIREISDMSPAQAAAFSEWLRNPAVVAKIFPKFQAGQTGEHSASAHGGD